METMDHLLADTPASMIDPNRLCGRFQFAREIGTLIQLRLAEEKADNEAGPVKPTKDDGQATRERRWSPFLPLRLTLE